MQDDFTGSARDEWRRGWGIVLAAALGIAIGGIYSHFIGAMIPALQEAHGWSRGEIASGLTLITASYMLGSLVVGNLVDRVGMRPVALWGCGLFCGGFSLLGFAGPDISEWYLFCTLFGALASSVGSVVWTGGVVKWFRVQRGMALALTLTGGGVMVSITPSIIFWLRGFADAGQVFIIVGVAGSALMFATTWLLFRDAPLVQGAPDRATLRAEAKASWRAAVFSRQFIQLFVAFFLVALAAGTFLIHIQPMLRDSGLTQMEAAAMAFAVGPSMIVGRLGMGALFDLYNPCRVGAFAFSLVVIAGLLLVNLDGDPRVSLVACIVVGLCLGAEVDALSYLTSRYFGLRAYGTVFSILGGGYGIATGVGSAVGGFTHDTFDSYDPWLLVLVGCGVVAIGLVLTLGRPTDDGQVGH
jgi:predicted MFS family arabinose efflux permease